MLRFNSSLPLSLSVIQKLTPQRYKLKLGTQIISTKSLTPLKVGHKYWANFTKTKDGILNINNLFEKPKILQNDINFLHVKYLNGLKNMANAKDFKSWVLKSLQTCEDQNSFKILCDILLALNENIIHLPFKTDFKTYLIQIKYQKNKILNKNMIKFYFAFDNLGAIMGEIDNNIALTAMYEKSASIIQNKVFKNMNIHVNVKKQTIVPIYESVEGLLDVKG